MTNSIHFYKRDENKVLKMLLNKTRQYNIQMPAKMSVTKELVPDILHMVPVTNFVNFFQVKLVYVTVNV